MADNAMRLTGTSLSITFQAIRQRSEPHSVVIRLSQCARVLEAKRVPGSDALKVKRFRRVNCVSTVLPGASILQYIH